LKDQRFYKYHRQLLAPSDWLGGTERRLGLFADSPDRLRVTGTATPPINYVRRGVVKTLTDRWIAIIFDLTPHISLVTVVHATVSAE